MRQTRYDLLIGIGASQEADLRIDSGDSPESILRPRKAHSVGPYFLGASSSEESNVIDVSAEYF
jgi:hypothetical protein